MRKYLSTNEMANLFDLNRQTLHFYDKENLFVPEFRDEETGYRKYSHNQIANLALICYLRKIGFSIKRIKSFMGLDNIDLIIKHLKNQSRILKKEYEEILNMDDIIQRKVEFVEKKLGSIELDQIEVGTFPKRAYIYLGEEDALYFNEDFYSFPTVAIYDYDKELKIHNKRFGAYLDPQVQISIQYVESIKFIKKQQFLYFYHKGPYEEISEKIYSIKKQYSELNLSMDAFCFNIVDQFLIKDPAKFITEVQVPFVQV